MRAFFLVVLAVLLVGAGILYSMFDNDITVARDALTGRSATVETSFGTVEYAEQGAGDAFLSIHGTGGGFDQGIDMMGNLADGYRLIAPSRFGYLGTSYPENATIALQSDAFAEFLDKLGVDKAIISGGSAGALSAMEFAIRYPERCRALVLLVPAAYAPTRKPNTSGAEGPMMETLLRTILGSDFIFWAGTRFLPDLMTRILLATDPAIVHAAEAKEQARVTAILHHILPVSSRAKGLLFDMKTAGTPEPQAIDRITCPVVTVSMKDDMFGTYDPAQYIAEHVPNGTAVLYPTCGHVWIGHVDDIRREIRGFLSEVEGKPVAQSVVPATAQAVP